MTGFLRTDVSPQDLFTRRSPTTLLTRVIQFPLARILTVVLFLAVPITIRNLIVIYGVERLSPPWFYVVLDLMAPIFVPVLFLFYALYTRRIEGREAGELSLTGAAPEFSAGAGMSALLVGASLVALLAAGSYRVVDLNNPWILLHALVLFTEGALLQELLVRLILYRLVEEWLGTWLAFPLIALLFGLFHLGNDGMTAAGFLGIVSGDILLLAAFALTRRIWLVWGLHAGWNFCQDGILGMPNSGITSLPSFIQPEISGPAWLTGGSVGIEASVLSSALTVLLGLWMVRLVIRRGQVVAPLWRREGGGEPGRSPGVLVG